MLVAAAAATTPLPVSSAAASRVRVSLDMCGLRWVGMDDGWWVWRRRAWSASRRRWRARMLASARAPSLAFLSGPGLVRGKRTGPGAEVAVGLGRHVDDGRIDGHVLCKLGRNDLVQ